MYGGVRAFPVQACIYETVLSETRIEYYIYFNFDISTTTTDIMATIDITSNTTTTTYFYYY